MRYKKMKIGCLFITFLFLTTSMFSNIGVTNENEKNVNVEMNINTYEGGYSPSSISTSPLEYFGETYTEVNDYETGTTTHPRKNSLSTEFIKTSRNIFWNNSEPAGNSFGQNPPLFEWGAAVGGSDYENGFSVQQTNDGGYILFGDTHSFGSGGDFYLTKFDSNGDLQWDFIYGDSGYEIGYSAQQTNDGGYILVGETDSFGEGGDILCIKLDSSGEWVWGKNFGWDSYEEGKSVVQTSDGGYAIAGCTSSFGQGSYNMLLMKIDATGNYEWSKAYGGSYSDFGSSVVQTNDGGYLLTGETNSFGNGLSDMYIKKTDSLGNSDWGWAYGYENSEWANQGRQVADGGFIIVGITDSFGPGSSDNVYLLKMHSDGSHDWSYAKGYEDSPNSGKDVHQENDGGYVFCSYNIPSGFYGSDIWLCKVDSNGNTIWDYQFGWSDDDIPESMDITSDGGYIVGGDTLSFGAGLRDMLIAKLAPNNPPNTPSDPDPYNGENHVHINHDISWSGGDPDGDTVYYKIWFGTDPDTFEVVKDFGDQYTSTSYNPGTLKEGTTYYWKIQGQDEHGVNGELNTWSFTTEEGNQKPNKPSTPSGESKGYTHVPYTFSVIASDPDGDDIQLCWDWEGDGNIDERTNFYEGGGKLYISHSWSTTGNYKIKVKAFDGELYSSWSDSHQITIYQSLCDFDVVDVYAEPEVFEYRDNVKIKAKIKNIGEVEYNGELLIKLYFTDIEYDSLDLILSETINDLNSGESVTISKNVLWIWGDWVKIFVHADPFNDIPEEDEENNKFIRNFIVKRPDLIVKKVWTEPKYIKPGQSNVKIKATVKNEGTDIAEHISSDKNWLVEMYIQGEDLSVEWKNFEINSIKPKNEKTFTWYLPFDWPLSFKEYEICARADVYSQVQESYEDNNEKCILKKATLAKNNNLFSDELNNIFIFSRYVFYFFFETLINPTAPHLSNNSYG